MTTYVVLAVVRIQQWLTRTPRLALVRGGSKALTELTAKEAVMSILEDIQPNEEERTLELCDETPEIAGVVVLSSADVVADKTIHALLDAMAKALPGVEWTAWAAEAESYIQAYKDTEGGQRAERFFRRPPSIRRLPMLAECEGCREESATELVRLPEEFGIYGTDCANRRAFALEEEEADQGTEKPKRAKEFSQLTRPEGTPEESSNCQVLLKAVGRRDSDNHLALIAADGNQVGNYFNKILGIGVVDVHINLSKALSEATEEACDKAQEKCLEYFDSKPKYLPVLKHYVGGDDVLVSVAGRFAWIWAITFGSQFSEIFQIKVREAVEASGLNETDSKELLEVSKKVSVGIGMVFAHNKAPFAEIYRLASEAEKIAKKETRGKRSAIAWGDFTVESDIKSQHVIDVSKAKSELECCLKSEEGESRCHDGEHLFWAANLNSSARSALKLALGPNEDDIKGALDWEKRTGNHCVKTRLVEINAAIRKAEENSTSGPPLTKEEKARKIGAVLLADLDRVRWWPELTETSPTKQEATS